MMDEAHTARLAELEGVKNRDENQEAEYQLILKHKAEEEAKTVSVRSDEIPVETTESFDAQLQ